MLGKFGVACIFLLSGLSLELSDLRQAATNHKLNASVLLTTFALWPMLVGVPLTTILETTFPNLLPPSLRDGLLILTCLPTTINVCVILTTAAGGSVATSLWNAVISNMAGIFITPLLLLRFFGKYIQLPFAAMVLKLCSQVMLPVGMYFIIYGCDCRCVLEKLDFSPTDWSPCHSFPRTAVGQALRQMGGKQVYEKNAKFFKRLQEVGSHDSGSH